MIIAAAPSVDAMLDKEQCVWDHILEHEPSVLLLLGDFARLPALSSTKMPSDRKAIASRQQVVYAQQRYADEIYQCYAMQAEITSFKNLLRQITTVGVIRSIADVSFQQHGHMCKMELLKSEFHLIGRTLHLQFRDWLQGSQNLCHYPEQPCLSTLLSGQNTELEEIIEIEKLRIILTRNRYFRQSSPVTCNDNILNAVCRRRDSDNLVTEDTVTVLCTTSPPPQSSNDEVIGEDPLLAQTELHRAMIVSTNKNKNLIVRHEKLYNLLELSISIANDTIENGLCANNFGIIEVNEWGLTASIYNNGKMAESDWSFVAKNQRRTI